MARNEEKHLGKLNRLWLQKEKEEGRIKDVHEARPRLSSLNTTAAVKKWIPSIKNELEYYLQQSQLSHYPERKIAEFRQLIEELENEYKRYIRKLRTLDPSCKHHPWTPRAYAKKRKDEDNPQRTDQTGKKLCTSELCDQSGQGSTGYDCLRSNGSEDTVASAEREHLIPSVSSVHSTSDLSCQDQPLSFNMAKMPLLFARSHTVQGGPQTENIVQVLLSGLPNLQSSPLAQAMAAQSSTCMKTGPKEPINPSLTPHRRSHVLGLGCYSSTSSSSSSDDDDDHCHHT